jgi:hypothetical protein
MNKRKQAGFNNLIVELPVNKTPQGQYRCGMIVYTVNRIILCVA